MRLKMYCYNSKLLQFERENVLWNMVKLGFKSVSSKNYLNRLITSSDILKKLSLDKD